MKDSSIPMTLNKNTNVTLASDLVLYANKIGGSVFLSTLRHRRVVGTTIANNGRTTMSDLGSRTGACVLRPTR